MKTALFISTALIAGVLFPPFPSRGAEAGSAPTLDLYRATVPSVDVNATTYGLRKATAAQLAAIDQFKNTYSSQTNIRGNHFTGSPDVIRGFHTAPSKDSPENGARNFVATNSRLFGVDPSALGLKEFVSGAITPGKTYSYRVVGFANGPTQVNITSKQYFPAGMAPPQEGGGSSTLPAVPGITPLRPLQFTVNPLTKTVTLKL